MTTIFRRSEILLGGIQGESQPGQHSTTTGPALNLAKTRFYLLALWGFAVLLQALLWASTENSIAAGLTLLGGFLGTSYGLRRNTLRSFPVSTTMVLGYTAYYFLIPPLATLAEVKPLTYNLDYPNEVFIHSFIGIVTIVCTHCIYRSWGLLQNFRWLINRKIYQPIGLFSKIPHRQLLLMGAIGLTAMAYQIFVAGSVQQEAQGAGNKFIQALFPLAYLPFLGLLPGITTTFGRFSRSQIFLFIGYSALLLVVSMARNARSSLLLGITSIALCFLYGLATGQISRRTLKLKYVAPIFLISILTAGPLTDLATAMVIVRGKRADLPAMELIQATVKAYNDKDTLRETQLDNTALAPGWDEHYTDNLFIARLANLKFTDNSLGLAMRMDNGIREYLRDIEGQRVLATFPKPVLELLKLPVDKELANSGSGGDFMLYAVTNSRYALGGFRTGSLLGSAYALFSWLYPLALLVTLLPIFAFGDAQTNRVLRSNQIIPIISPMIGIAFFSWFYFLTSAATGIESFSGLFAYILRGWLQTALIWLVAYKATKLMSRVVFRSGKI